MQAIKKAVLVCCMDYRHGRGINLEDSIRGAYDQDYGFYRLTWPGGAGVLTEIDPEIRALFVRNIKLAIEKLHAEEVFITVHGTNEYDNNGCGGYILNGFEGAYKDSNESAGFSVKQLKKAAAFLYEQGIVVPITALYVTFNGIGNVVTEVCVAGEVSPLTIGKEMTLQS
jgi:hypothetical protein